MEEEIDVRPYIEALLKYWYWIVGVAVVAGLIVFVLASALPKSYEATALIAAIEPRDIVQFDERIRETNQVQPLKAFPQLALSDQILVQVLAAYPMDEIDTLTELRKVLSAEAGADASIIEFQVVLSDPQQSAELANTWANVFVDWTNAIYGNRNDEQVVFFLQQMEKAEQDLALADQTLVDYQAINQTYVISNTLTSALQAHSDLLDSQRQATSLLQDVLGLRNQLAQSGNVSEITTAEQLTVILLQLQAFGVQTESSMQIQLGEGVWATAVTRQQQIQLLDDLLATLNERVVQSDAEQALLEPKILELQERYQEMNTENQRLLLNQRILQETYTALALKVQEEQIVTADTNSGVRLASEASVPENPVDTTRLLAVLFTTSFMLIIGSMIVVMRVWWQEK